MDSMPLVSAMRCPSASGNMIKALPGWLACRESDGHINRLDVLPISRMTLQNQFHALALSL
jgi:hypothetical protein